VIVALIASASASATENAPSKPIRHGCRNRLEIALTFDGCMSPAMERRKKQGASFYDPRIIQILKQTHTQATIFLSGLWLQNHPQQSQALIQDPLFELGNHGQAHRAFTSRCFGLPAVRPGDEQSEIAPAQDLFRHLLHLTPRWFRFPGGCADQADLFAIHQAGLVPIGWDVYGQDGKQPSSARIERNVLSRVRGGSIVLLHLIGGENAPQTAAALPGILQGLRRAGYLPVKLSELLSLPCQTQIVDAAAPPP
jgi:peptidoglycan/xylan/chitin deacetylase (PgdA/CDA1 family)